MRKITQLILTLALLAPVAPLIAANAKAKESRLKPLASDSVINRPAGKHAGRDLRIEIKGDYRGLEGEADFIVADGSQANYVTGGDRGFKVMTGPGETPEFKKWGFIVNATPVIDPSNPQKISIQLQIEISGPVEGKDGVNMDMWQFQSEFGVVKGKWKEIVAKPAKVAIRVSDAQDE